MIGTGETSFIPSPAFNGLFGVHIDSQDKIYIAETLNHRINDMTGAGWVESCNRPDAYIRGAGTNQFTTPTSIFVK